MAHPTLTIPRSASLPASSEEVRGNLFQTPFRRDSEIIVSECPITPPMSPGHSEDGGEEAIIVDTERRFSGLERDIFPESTAPTGLHSHQNAIHWRETGDMEVDRQVSTGSPRPPLRLLEDEKVHVEKSGSLKLMDFEVKGTLGLCTHKSFLVPLLLDFKAPALSAEFSSCACGQHQRKLILRDTLL